MNPSKMRNTYGKLIYIIMDTESYAVKQELNLNFIKPVLTIELLLSSFGDEAREMLEDPLLVMATRDPSASLEGRTPSRREAERGLAQRKEARVRLIAKYLGKGQIETRKKGKRLGLRIRF